MLFKLILVVYVVIFIWAFAKGRGQESVRDIVLVCLMGIPLLLWYVTNEGAFPWEPF